LFVAHFSSGLSRDAIAAKNARMAWAMLARGEQFKLAA
jgi:hypothetical protein